MNHTRYPICPRRSVFFLLACIAFALAACGAPPSSPAAASSVQSALSLDPARSLMIIDTSVVNDSRTVYSSPDNAWSFGALMENAAGLGNPSRFATSWLEQWERDEQINGFTVPARPSIRQLVIDPWLVASGCPAGADNCRLDFTKAPFRLLAIVSRLDLRQPGNAGQGRFVFNVLDQAGNPFLFNIILEYQLQAANTWEVQEWAQRWSDLSNQPFGDGFNQALERITQKFAGRFAAPLNVNGSALLQLRSNEVVLSLSMTPHLWQMRQFKLSAPTGRLKQGTVPQTPDLSFNNTQKLANFIMNNANAIRAGTAQVDPTMLAGSADVPGLPKPSPSDLVWAAPGVPPDLMQDFAMMTCNGCHLSATGTRFTMVKPRQLGVPSVLADVVVNTFLPARAADLQKLLEGEDDGGGILGE